MQLLTGYSAQMPPLGKVACPCWGGRKRAHGDRRTDTGPGRGRLPCSRAPPPGQSPASSRPHPGPRPPGQSPAPSRPRPLPGVPSAPPRSDSRRPPEGGLVYSPHAAAGREFPCPRVRRGHGSSAGGQRGRFPAGQRPSGARACARPQPPSSPAGLGPRPPGPGAPRCSRCNLQGTGRDSQWGPLGGD